MYYCANISEKKARMLGYAVEYALKHYCGQGVTCEVHVLIHQELDTKSKEFVVYSEDAGKAYPKGTEEPKVEVSTLPNGQLECTDMAGWAFARRFMMEKREEKDRFADRIDYDLDFYQGRFAASTPTISTPVNGHWEGDTTRTTNQWAGVSIFVITELGTGLGGMMMPEAPRYVAAAIAIALRIMTENDLAPFHDACYKIYRRILDRYDGGGLTYEHLKSLDDKLSKALKLVGETPKIL